MPDKQHDPPLQHPRKKAQDLTSNSRIYLPRHMYSSHQYNTTLHLSFGCPYIQSLLNSRDPHRVYI